MIQGISTVYEPIIMYTCSQKYIAIILLGISGYSCHAYCLPLTAVPTLHSALPWYLLAEDRHVFTAVPTLHSALP